MSFRNRLWPFHLQTIPNWRIDTESIGQARGSRVGCAQQAHLEQALADPCLSGSVVTIYIYNYIYNILYNY